MFARGGPADLGERVALDFFAVLNDGVHQAHTGMTVVSNGLGNLKIGESGDKLPSVASPRPHLELLPARHCTSLDAEPKKTKGLLDQKRVHAAGLPLAQLLGMLLKAL
jgi:hypothetical protein